MSRHRVAPGREQWTVAVILERLASERPRRFAPPPQAPMEPVTVVPRLTARAAMLGLWMSRRPQGPDPELADVFPLRRRRSSGADNDGVTLPDPCAVNQAPPLQSAYAMQLGRVA